MSRAKLVVMMFALLALVLAACSGSNSDGVASLEGGSPSESESGGPSGTVTEEETLLTFAQCMRDNGVENFEDPIVNPDGSVEFGFLGDNSESDPFTTTDQDTLAEAFAACNEGLLGLAFGPDGGFDLSSFQDTLVEFAQCMRDNGVDVDDPDLSDFLPGNGEPGQVAGPFGDLDITDPDVRAGLDACQSLFAGFGTFGGDS